jgi:hypothetical protein
MTANDQSIQSVQCIQSPLRHAVDLALLSGARAAQIATANGIGLYMPTLAATLQMLSAENNLTGSKAGITNLKVVLSHLQKALGRMAVQSDPDLFELNLFVCTLQLVLKRAREVSKSTKPQC